MYNSVRILMLSPGEQQRTVLAVDDDPAVLDLVSLVLRRLNLRVIPANGAEDALRVFHSLEEPPDLLLTDVTMPGVSGRALAAEILRVCPDIRVLFMSGYDNRQTGQKCIIEPDFPLLAKPFTCEILGKLVIEVLNSASRTAARYA